MHVIKEHIYTIISRHLTGNITKEESILLEDWLSKDSKNQIEFDDIVALWHKSQSLKFPGKIKTDLALNTVHEKGGIRQISKIFRLNIIQQIAAILILSVLLVGLYNYFITGKYGPMFYQEVSAAYGTKVNVDLPDGTTVVLNSGSSLRFSGLFDHKSIRKVELTGEGFFNVTKNPRKPFIVKVGKFDVKVLGTTFNVHANDSKSEIEIVLVEGKVAIGNMNSKLTDNLIVLNPGQLAYLDITGGQNYKKANINMEKYIGWVEGKIVFEDDSIQEVIKRLEGWYNVDIKIADDRLLKYRFTGTFVNESLEGILEVLCRTSPLRYEILTAENSGGKHAKRTIILKMNEIK